MMEIGFHAHCVYAEQLYPLGHGMPLWEPEPTRSGPVQIGDVGYIQEGGFYRLFNAMCSADDPLNRDHLGCPQGHEPLVVNETLMNERDNALQPGPLYSRNVREIQAAGALSVAGNGGAFSCNYTGDKGGLLILQDSATRKTYHAYNAMEDYMRKNFESWYSFANDTHQIGLSQEDIIFVRGWVKTAQWAVAAFSNTGRSGSLTFSINPTMPLNASLTVSVSNGAGVATSQHRVGPSRQIPIESLPALAGSESEQVQPQAATRSGEVADQCVFLRYYKMKQRKLLPRKIEAAADPPDDSTGSHDDMDITNDAITDLTSMDGIRPSLIPPQSKAHDPVDDILTYILENSDATAALASDEDVYGLDLGDDNDSTNSFTARLEKIRPVLTVNNGLGILRNEKEKSSRIRHDSVTGCTHSCGLPHGVQPSGYSDSLTYEPPAGPPSDSGNPDEGYEYHHDHHDHLQGGYVPPPSPRPSVHEGGSSPISARQYGYQPPLSPPREYGTYGASDATPLSPPTSQKRHGQVWEDADQQQQILFQDSQYTGKKRALLIGINYIGQSAELKSPINDARLFKSLLLENYGYSEGNIVMLTDDLPHPRQIPTQQNILEEIRRLVRDARPGDQLTFFYSGHGGRTKKPDSEEDGCDNDIYPVDFQINGHITSKGMRDVLVTPVPNECRLTAIFDCCISSAILDLPYTYTAEDRTKEPSLAIQDQTPVDLSNTDTAGSNILEPNLAAETEEGLLNADTCMMGLNKEPSQSVGSEESSGARNRTQESKTSSADIISWSCRRDSPRRADILQDGQAAGVMSHALVTTLMENPKQSYQQLLTNISRGILRRKYGLIPQLSSSRPMNTRLLFTC